MASGKWQKIVQFQFVVKNKTNNSVRHAVLVTVSRVTNSLPALFPRYLWLRTGMTTSRELGFTLIELAITLVIIGLLVGGVLVGRDLIAAAEIRSLVTLIDNYKTATMTFKDKYGYLPGDMPNATAYWGQSPNAFWTLQPRGTATWNGDGNGILAEISDEQFRFWQHLSNADLIKGKGTFTGTPNGICNNCLTAGVDVPFGINESQAIYLSPSCGYKINWQPAWHFDGCESSIKHYFYVFGTVGARAGALTPAEMKALDDKIDDGLPNTGTVKVLGQDYTNCVTGYTNAAVPYYSVKTVTTKNCTPIFNAGF